MRRQKESLTSNAYSDTLMHPSETPICNKFIRQLLDQTCRVANVLKKRGINKGDVVVICMPTMPLAVASMLACARIGAVHWYVYHTVKLRHTVKA